MNILNKKYYLVSIFAVALLFVFPITIFAQTNDAQRQKIVILTKDQTVTHDYFAAGNTVTIDGTINGDAYIAGGQIDINGTINGDLLVAGGQITIRGKVTQNIRAVGGTIFVKGNVGRNVTLAGGNILIDNDATVTGNVVVAGGNIQILTKVKDLILAAGSAVVKSDVMGNLEAAVGKLDLSSTSTIHGNVDYWSNDKAMLTSGATVLGTTTFHQTQVPANVSRTSGKIIGASVAFSVMSFISFLIIALLLVWLLPVYSQKTSDLVVGKFWTNLLVGFIALVVTPVAVLVLLMTVIGIPIALLLLLAYVVVLYISKIFVALAVGKLISKRAKWNLSPIWALIVGLVLYYIIGFIPLIGPFAKIVVVLVGMGVVIIQKKEYYTMFRTKKII